MRETLIQDRYAERAAVVRNTGQLVQIAAAEEAQPTHDVELLRMKQVKPKAAGLVYHVMAVIELVDVDREPRERWDNRGAHRGVGDHTVLLAATLRSDGDHRRCEIAEELVGEVGLEHTSRYMSAIASLPERSEEHTSE